MKLLFTEDEMAQDITRTLHSVGLKATTEYEMEEEIALMPYEPCKQLKAKAKTALFNLAYPAGAAAYEGNHKKGQMINGQKFLLKGILSLLKERN